MLATTEEANEYRNKFHKYYYERIAPLLQEFEIFRNKQMLKYKTYQSLAIISAIIVIGLAAFFILTSPQIPLQNNLYLIKTVIFGVVIVCLFLGLAGNIPISFNQKVKEAIINTFLEFFGNFEWHSGEKFSAEELNYYNLFDYVKTSSSGYDSDYFEGQYKNLKIIISEALLINEDVPIFDGVLVQIELNKNFNAHTIIVEKCLTSIDSGLFWENVGKIELEDTEFNKCFKVFSDNQVEARYILTPSMMERFKNLKETFKTTGIRAAFRDKSLLIAIPSNENLFEVCDFKKPVTDTGQIRELFEQFLAILSLVDILHLNSKTGL